MPRFEPFCGLRYDTTKFDLAEVTSPPYDVIDAQDRRRLLARNPDNIVAVDLPQPSDGPDPYALAAERFRSWIDKGMILVDDAASFYGYQMTFECGEGTGTATRRMTGVFGAMELCEPGARPNGATPILPHEFTTPKAKSDRTSLLDATAVNLSAVWGLSPAIGLTGLLSPQNEDVVTWHDEAGVRHDAWRIMAPDRITAISEAISSEPVVIADGHHRFETSLAYRNKRRAVDGTGGPYDAVMTYVVELSEDELIVQPIHRLIKGLPSGFDLVDALNQFFEITPINQPIPGERETLTLVSPSGFHALKPRSTLLSQARDLDTSRLDVALATLPQHELSFQHGVDQIIDRVRTGQAEAGILLRPATVSQIVEIAHGGERMPPKTTYFHPKPATGVVFRDVR